MQLRPEPEAADAASKAVPKPSPKLSKGEKSLTTSERVARFGACDPVGMATRGHTRPGGRPTGGRILAREQGLEGLEPWGLACVG